MLAAAKTSFFHSKNIGFLKYKLGQAADWNQTIKHLVFDDDCCVSQNIGRTKRNLVKSNNLDFS